ncbi:hypothetical protein FHS10_000389 [Mucilaginibacter dorajii]|uniref:TF-B3 domain-containing protein n=2 Tax=Mucilaginibacter dorajii TaxID=692994 RepID=A0ABP7QWS1_9SPHI|nr:hypothetical protein [Mucilaginibacter dorajii]
MAVFIGSLELYDIKRNKDKVIKLAEIHKAPLYLKGLITYFHSSKGHSISIKYNVHGISYEYNGGWDRNVQQLKAGDSIWIKCSVKQPELAICELEDGY